jgi:hypothetical protein
VIRNAKFFKSLIQLAQLFPQPFSQIHPLTPSLAKRKGIGAGWSSPLFSREGERGGELLKNKHLNNIKGL